MLALVAAAALALPSAMWVCLVATLLALAGVVLFSRQRLAHRFAAGRGGGARLALLDAFAGLLTPTAYGAGLVRKVDPKWWPQPHPVLGFRPKPDSTAVATATFNGQPVYNTTYGVDSKGGRRQTPPGAPISTWAIASCCSGIRVAGLCHRQLRHGNSRVRHAELERAGQRAQPPGARLRGGPARPVCRPAGEGRGRLDHPGPARAHHRRRLVARLLAALRACRRQALCIPARSPSIIQRFHRRAEVLPRRALPLHRIDRREAAAGASRFACSSP